jgi:anaerobic magnesium-protoporphyrin IX monomethyl ester cyclase
LYPFGVAGCYNNFSFSCISDNFLVWLLEGFIGVAVMPHIMKIALIEPPKDFWFVMGKYIPPPFGLLCLASYLEQENPDANINLIDCQSEGLDWDSLEDRLSEIQPDIVAPSSLATANAYYSLRVCQIVKQLNPEIKTVLGGQHFTALADETLSKYPEVDFIIRGEGEKTFSELVGCIKLETGFEDILGLSYRGEQIFHNIDRPLFCNLDVLPAPAYHLVEDHMNDYHFSLMAEEHPFAIVEGSRGCHHNCSYCSQWRFWKQRQRYKSPKLVVNEFYRLYTEFGSKFFWFTDDNFSLGKHTDEICQGLIEMGLNDEIQWFCQLRVDNIMAHPDNLENLRKAGAIWALVGFDNPSSKILSSYRRRGLEKDNSKQAVDLLRDNEIFSQGTFIIGHQTDTRESIEVLREYADYLDPDIASFFTLTPFPGTDIYLEAREKGRIEDNNWANYDMVHAIMPTDNLTREEVQEELYKCYNHFFGSWPRRYRGILSENPVTRHTYGYLAKQSILANLKDLIN